MKTKVTLDLLDQNDFNASYETGVVKSKLYSGNFSGSDFVERCLDTLSSSRNLPTYSSKKNTYSLSEVESYCEQEIYSAFGEDKPLLPVIKKLYEVIKSASQKKLITQDYRSVTVGAS